MIQKVVTPMKIGVQSFFPVILMKTGMRAQGAEITRRVKTGFL
jgi:hypothetical protein